MSQRRSRSVSKSNRNKTTTTTPKLTISVRPPRRRKENQDLGVQVKAPVSSQRIIQSKRPRQYMTAKGTRVQHKELLDESVIGSTSFAIRESINISPGNGRLQWLKSIAAPFEFYKIHSMSFQYASLRSTGTDGNVMLAFAYDPEADFPENERALASVQPYRQTPVWQGTVLNIDPVLAMGGLSKKHVRTFLSGAERRTSDLGVFYVGVIGVDDTEPIGQIYIHYDIEFYNPVNIVQTPIARCTALWYKAADQAIGTASWNAVTFLNPCGKLPIINNALSNSAQFWSPPGVYRFHCELRIGWGSGVSTVPVYVARATYGGLGLESGLVESSQCNLAQFQITTGDAGFCNLHLQGIIYFDGSPNAPAFGSKIFQIEVDDNGDGTPTSSIFAQSNIMFELA